MTRFVYAFVVTLVCCQNVHAQSAVYSPYASWQPSPSLWESNRNSLEATSKKSVRPVLPGLRPASVELLQDALLRKHTSKLRNDPRMARQLMSRILTSKGRNQHNGAMNSLHGAMAEALFLQKNTEWAYVSKPNAPQHDVYRNRVRKPPENGQIKFHRSGTPSTYARDMLKDHLAHKFFVPDDHAKPLHDFLLRKYEFAKQRGDTVAMNEAVRNRGRVQSMGLTSQEIVTNTKQALQYSASESRSVYVSLAAGVALSLGEIGWEFAHGTLSADQAAYRTTKTLSLVGTGVAANAVLARVREGALRGTLKGNVLVGVVVLLADNSWSIYENGGLVALRHPEFYEQLGGSVSATVLGGGIAIYVGIVTAESGPVLAGLAAFSSGTVVGVVAYIGGRSTTSWLVRSFWPELYRRDVQQHIAAAKEGISGRIARAQSGK